MYIENNYNMTCDFSKLECYVTGRCYNHQPKPSLYIPITSKSITLLGNVNDVTGHDLSAIFSA